MAPAARLEIVERRLEIFLSHLRAVGAAFDHAADSGLEGALAQRGKIGTGGTIALLREQVEVQAGGCWPAGEVELENRTPLSEVGQAHIDYFREESWRE